MESTMISLPPAPEISEIPEMRDVPKEHQPDQRLVLKRSTAALQDMGIVIDPRDLKTTIQKQMGQLVVHMATGQHQLELALARTFFAFSLVLHSRTERALYLERMFTSGIDRVATEVKQVATDVSHVRKELEEFRTEVRSTSYNSYDVSGLLF